MNVNLKIKIKIKSFRKKKVPQKFKTCNCLSVKKTIIFFFWVFYYYYFNQGWIPNFSIKLIGRENWSWIWSGMLKFSKQYHQSMKPELVKYINNALKVKVRLWQVFFFNNRLWQVFVNLQSVFIFDFTVKGSMVFLYAIKLKLIL